MLNRLVSKIAAPWLRSLVAKATEQPVQTAAIAAGTAAAATTGVLVYRYYYARAMHLAAFAQTSPLDPKSFKPFKLAEIHPVNHNTKIFRFALDSPDQELGLPVASCIVTRTIGEDGKPIIRPYTPLAGDAKGYFDLLIKVYPEGKMSKHIHSMKPGDTLEVKGPISKIPYKPNMKKQIGMIAGGTGITPMLQVIHEILKNPEDKTEVSLVFANIAEQDILLKDQLDELQRKHKNFKVHYVLEKPPANWNGSVGFVTEETVKKYMPQPGPDTLVMVCGPPGMMKAVSGEKAPDYSQGEVDGILKKLNYQKEHVFKF